MSILIKGAEMPRSCFGCPFMYARRFCSCNPEIEFTDDEYSELKGRYDGCPLVEVPAQHGRLIDADWVLAHVKPYEPKDERWAVTGGTAIRLINNAVNRAPTIIEKEEDNQ